MKIRICLAAALLLGGCAGTATREPPAAYDFGPQREDAVAAKTIRASVLLQNVIAPAWLDTPAIFYRLGYQDASRQRTYANSRWASAPAALLTQRLRNRLTAVSDGGVVSMSDGAHTDYALRVELEEFSQVFDSAERSRGVVMVRASLVNATRRVLVAQKSFSVERAAVSADAEGGVRALAAAGGEAVDAIVAWTAAGIAQDRK